MTLPPSLGRTESAGSLESLTSLLTRLRDEQSTGIIQAGQVDARQLVFVHAHGILAGSYAVEEGVSRPIHQNDIDALWDKNRSPLQFIPTPGTFGRMAWLALESSLQSRSDLRAEAEWDQQTQEWKRVNFSGLAEVTTGDGVGYLWFESGRNLAPESAFIGPATSVSFPANLAVYTAIPESNAHQCFSLRLTALKWANGILSRFQQVAGQKFVQAIGRELTSLIQPWGWQIFVENGCLRDDHFFPRVAAATHAYRAIFMGMGSQMSFVIGNMLTQRILSEMFYELEGDERATLSLHRLIPAAFSE